MFSLIDCNNFFVSCERVFDPKLLNVPVAVLSSNDGCVISRSNEAKAMGVPMGAPYFKFKDFFREKNVRIFSSNFGLYSDMSRRVMNLLAQFSENVEIYSIDEAFLKVPMHCNSYEWGREVRDTIICKTGIPVSVGIARTKTLSKIAGHIAKEMGKRGGSEIFDFEAAKNKEEILGSLTAGEVWGIGGNTARSLLNHPQKIKTALDFAQMPDHWIQKNYGIGGLKIALELRGIPTLCGNNGVEAKKSIRSSRSFGKPVLELAHLERSIAEHVILASRKMRYETSAASFVSVFIGTGKYSNDARYYNSSIRAFALPTTDTCDIIIQAKEALREIYRHGFRYKRSGIMLGGFVSQDLVPHRSLFGNTGVAQKQAFMNLIDTINERYGKTVITPLSALPKNEWAARKEFCSPAYTTSWSEIITIKI